MDTNRQFLNLIAQNINGKEDCSCFMYVLVYMCIRVCQVLHYSGVIKHTYYRIDLLNTVHKNEKTNKYGTSICLLNLPEIPLKINNKIINNTLTLV